MKQYLQLLQHIIDNGLLKENRTGNNSYSVFGYQTRFDLAKGLPLITTKKIHFKSVVHELLWFLKGDTNIKYLTDNNVRIWNEWATEDGELGPVYGKLWRSWAGANGEVDQIKTLLANLQKFPHSRRHIISAWEPLLLPDETISAQDNVALGKQALAACHCLFQFYVSADNKLSCQLYQRSADAFLGVPFNIASYSLLTIMIAQITGLKLGEFVHTFGDLHIYQDHLQQVKIQLEREPMTLPQIKLNSQITDLFEFEYQDIELIDYEHHPALKGKVSV